MTTGYGAVAGGVDAGRAPPARRAPPLAAALCVCAIAAASFRAGVDYGGFTCLGCRPAIARPFSPPRPAHCFVARPDGRPGARRRKPKRKPVKAPKKLDGFDEHAAPRAAPAPHPAFGVPHHATLVPVPPAGVAGKT